MLIGIILLIFVVTSGAAYLLLGGRSRQPNTVQERLEVIGGIRENYELYPPQPRSKQGGEAGSSSGRLRPDLLPALTRLLSGSAIESNLRASILRAGMRVRPGEFLVLCLLCSVGGGLAGYLYTHQAPLAVITTVIG